MSHVVRLVVAECPELMTGNTHPGVRVTMTDSRTHVVSPQPREYVTTRYWLLTVSSILYSYVLGGGDCAVSAGMSWTTPADGGELRIPRGQLPAGLVPGPRSRDVDGLLPGSGEGSVSRADLRQAGTETTVPCSPCHHLNTTATTATTTTTAAWSVSTQCCLG